MPLFEELDRAIPPDQCRICGAHTKYPWINHWIPGATMECDGEPEGLWVNGAPIGMPEYVRPKARP